MTDEPFNRDTHANRADGRPDDFQLYGGENYLLGWYRVGTSNLRGDRSLECSGNRTVRAVVEYGNLTAAAGLGVLGLIARRTQSA